MIERSRRAGTGLAVGLAVLLILIAALAACIGGYFALGTEEQVTAPFQKIGEPRREYIRARAFTYRWQASLFAPASQAESLIRGEPVETAARARPWDRHGARAG